MEYQGRNVDARFHAIVFFSRAFSPSSALEQRGCFYTLLKRSSFTFNPEGLIIAVVKYLAFYLFKLN